MNPPRRETLQMTEIMHKIMTQLHFHLSIQNPRRLFIPFVFSVFLLIGVISIEFNG